MRESQKAWCVHGRVQGVGFRYFVAGEALALGMAGGVRNLPDGTVEVQARGEERSMVRFEEALKRGPAHARVVRLEPIPASPRLESMRSFKIDY